MRDVVPPIIHDTWTFGDYGLSANQKPERSRVGKCRFVDIGAGLDEVAYDIDVAGGSSAPQRRGTLNRLAVEAHRSGLQL